MDNLNVLILGGDTRYVEVIDAFADKGASVYVAGYDHLALSSSIHKTSVKNVNFSKMDAIILPVAGTDTSGNIEATFSDEIFMLTEELLAQTPKHCTIYTGTANSYLEKLAQTTNRKLVKLFARDDIAIMNSIPTAEATLKIAIEETDETIHRSNVTVLGFGRVGITVARLFGVVGANVYVAARKPADIARITEMGLKAVSFNEIDKIIGKMDITINTVPHHVLDAKRIATMKKNSLIIDLASKPGGTDFSAAKQEGVHAIHALGLPGKTAAKTAGKIIANVLTDVISTSKT